MGVSHISIHVPSSPPKKNKGRNVVLLFSYKGSLENSPLMATDVCNSGGRGNENDSVHFPKCVAQTSIQTEHLVNYTVNAYYQIPPSGSTFLTTPTKVKHF